LATRGTGARGCGARGTGSRDNAPRQGNKLWTRSKNEDGKFKLDLIVDWLTVEGNYQTWRSSEMSKRDVCELVLIYLAGNGYEDQECDWKGVEQQVITSPSGSYWELLTMINQLDYSLWCSKYVINFQFFSHLIFLYFSYISLFLFPTSHFFS
jgi:hypothetical protein